MKYSIIRLFRLSVFLIFAGCSLSHDLARMDDVDDYEAYAYKWAPSEDAFVAVQRVAKPYIDRKDWYGALAVFERFKPLFPDMQKRFDAIKDILVEPSSDVHVMNLGRGVNTNSNEIKATMTVDGKRIYFASDRPGGKGGLDIYVSKFENGEWSPAINLGDRINTGEHETINGLSFDGTALLIYGGFPGHMGRGDNYYYEKTEQGWSAIKHFPPPVNSNSYDSDAFLTADGRAVFFISDREGAIGKRVVKGTSFHGGTTGNTDIWVSVRRGNIWLPPVNLGPKINTPYCERSAFLHPDGKTLYFSSDGHSGLGKLDVFKSVRLREDSWTEWSEPVNLGKDINTSEDDWGYKISPDGATAIFSASNLGGGFGEGDIYQMTLPGVARPASEVATISGTIVDENGNPIGANIKVEDLESGNLVAELRSDPQTGEISMALPMDKNYGIFLEREGYYPDSKNLDLRKGSALREGSGSDNDDAFALKFNMKSVESMKSMRDKYGELLAQRVNNIFFDFAKWDLKPESFFELDRLVRFLATNPTIRIQIGAHTDDVGSDAFNLDLSDKRAKSVVDHLISRGINPDRLVSKGYGESRPEVPNDSDENRALNRRVEFRIAE